jgi:hypothetical protein
LFSSPLGAPDSVPTRRWAIRLGRYQDDGRWQATWMLRVKSGFIARRRRNYAKIEKYAGNPPHKNRNSHSISPRGFGVFAVSRTGFASKPDGISIGEAHLDSRRIAAAALPFWKPSRRAPEFVARGSGLGDACGPVPCNLLASSLEHLGVDCWACGARGGIH